LLRRLADLAQERQPARIVADVGERGVDRGFRQADQTLLILATALSSHSKA
jgi:hypothetical protein